MSIHDYYGISRGLARQVLVSIDYLPMLKRYDADESMLNVEPLVIETGVRKEHHFFLATLDYSRKEDAHRDLTIEEKIALTASGNYSCEEISALWLDQLNTLSIQGSLEAMRGIQLDIGFSNNLSGQRMIEGVVPLLNYFRDRGVRKVEDVGKFSPLAV